MTESEYPVFDHLGYQRQKCVKCGKHFWSSERRATCGDSDCDRYTFLGAKMVPKPYDVNSMRKEFIDFFRSSHGVVKPYPVVPRWREDVLLVNASIYDFQPHVTMGFAKPPENPLVMSQPCIRMTDVENVGVTGRHLTGFEMMCHDSFNSPGHEVYWKNGTIEYCNNLLTQALRIDRANVTYTEKPWSGGGNAGNALEVFVGGVEIATLVFMDLRRDPKGERIIDGEKYSPMEMRVVDTGYGLERMTWLSRSKGTIYDAVYPELVSHLLDLSGTEPLPEDQLMQYLDFAIHSDPYSEKDVITGTVKALSSRDSGFSERSFLDSLSKMRAIWSLSDHSRTLLFMLSSHVIPSNVRVGYLARLLIRKALRHFKTLGIDDNLDELIDLQSRNYREIIGKFDLDFSKTLLERERTKYAEVIRNGTSLVHRMIDKKGSLSERDVSELYESHGIPPETVAQIVTEKIGKPVSFNRLQIRENVEAHEKADTFQIEKYDTRPLYYDDTSIREFTAIVVHSGNNFVVLNQTAFYPEGGGQPFDTGFLFYGSKKFEVSRVQKINGTIVHFIDGVIPEKVRVRGVIDSERRERLMVSHSATHLLLAVTREVLGPHIWQSGVQKGTDYSRLDVTHYEKISDADVKRIEMRCLELIRQGKTISVKMVEWNSALKKYGFRLFQGGVPLSNKLRVVEIEDTDAEGCGGTHLKNTSQIGMIKIVRVESIQEGIQRIIFASGIGALEYSQKLQAFYNSTVPYLASGIDDAAEKFSRVYEGYLEKRKSHERIIDEMADLLMSTAEPMKENGIEFYRVRGMVNEEILPALVPRAKKIHAPLLVYSSTGGTGKITLVSYGDTATGILAQLSGTSEGITGNGRVASQPIGNSNEKLIS